MPTKNAFFICECCGLEQNLDQSVHVDQNYCVSCYNKEQIYRDVKRKFNAFKYYLQDRNKYTKIRRKKIRMLKNLSEILLPLTIFDLEVGEVEDELHEAQRDAVKKAMKEIQDKYDFHINEDAITYELVAKLRPIFEYKRYSTEKKEKILRHLDPFIDKPIKNLHSFFTDIKKHATVPAFVRRNRKFKVIQTSPFQFNDSYLLRTTKAYVKRIKKAYSQPERFRHFIKVIGQDCQFQTINDMLKESIEKFAKDMAPNRIEQLFQRMQKEINIVEDSKLIPNIAKYIMDNHEYVFETWFTKILPFDKSRFMASQAKTGSRTDFIVRLQYTFRNYELRMIKHALENTAELLLRQKAEKKIAKYRNDSNLDDTKKQERIQREEKRLEKKLQPPNLEEFREKNASGALMVARFLILNTEKAFNFILDRIIQFHYERLNIQTSVHYITNVLESGASEKKGNLKAYYLIQSREW